MPECRCYRFIPAGAGNTSSLHGRNKRHSVYPRWRGEHPEITLNWLSVSGLSPLARGTPRLGVRVGIIGRFIPAGAGNTWSWWKPTVPVAVYPRWRGEHRSPSRVVYVIVGLSPLARGTPHRAGIPRGFWRFIPAGAGNTYQRYQPRFPSPVYPRWRGEHCLYICRSVVVIGLSPLARGTPAHYMGEINAIRFIPAGAGNTLRLR